MFWAEVPLTAKVGWASGRQMCRAWNGLGTQGGGGDPRREVTGLSPAMLGSRAGSALITPPVIGAKVPTSQGWLL